MKKILYSIFFYTSLVSIGFLFIWKHGIPGEVHVSDGYIVKFPSESYTLVHLLDKIGTYLAIPLTIIGMVLYIYEWRQLTKSAYSKENVVIVEGCTREYLIKFMVWSIFLVVLGILSLIEAYFLYQFRM